MFWKPLLKSFLFFTNRKNIAVQNIDSTFLIVKEIIITNLMQNAVQHMKPKEVAECTVYESIAKLWMEKNHEQISTTTSAYYYRIYIILYGY